jgi:hypothetical protein
MIPIRDFDDFRKGDYLTIITQYMDTIVMNIVYVTKKTKLKMNVKVIQNIPNSFEFNPEVDRLYELRKDLETNFINKKSLDIRYLRAYRLTDDEIKELIIDRL